MANPAPSALYCAVETRYRELKRKFISREIGLERKDPLNYQPDRERIAAFRLLFHAELEDYLESKAKAFLHSVQTDIRRGALVLDRLDWYALAAHFEIPLPIFCPHDAVKFKPISERVVVEGLAFVSKNNGIKATSFTILSLLAGKKMGEVDDSLAVSLNDYGKDRGNVAHQSVTRVRNLMGPGIENTSAFNLMRALRFYYYGY